MFKDTVTVFNHVEDKRAGISQWYAHVLEDAELQVSLGENYSKEGNISNDTANLHVRKLDCYLKPKVYAACEDKETYFTFKEGDFFVLGDLGSGIIDDNEFRSGYFEHIRAKHDDVYRVNTVQYFKAIQHLEVGGS